MPSDVGYFGYGTRSGYVRFMAGRGVPLSLIAEALQTSICQMMRGCPDLDFYKYRFFENGSGAAVSLRWSNDDIRKVIEFYPTHGAAWDGWHVLLPGRSTGSIRTIAGKLGCFYIPKGKR